MFRLDGKTALVTGSGRGIGRAIAAQLTQAGAKVMINDLDAGVAAETASALDTKFLAGSVTDPAFPQQLVDATVEQFGGLDIIVNNAGYTWDNVIQKTTDEQFQAMLDIHVTAPFRILRAASGFIRERAKAEAAAGQPVMRKVVNISSVSGVYGNAGQIGYGAGKMGINGITHVMAKEWGRYSVNVNSVAFGFIETRLTQAWDPANASIDIAGRNIAVGVQPAVLATMKQAVPLGRLGTPEEAAGAVLFFCSPLSDYVSGEILVVSGGMRN
jgi:3-oxoacyl-[acyl-carrier protein] reductase